MKFLITIVCLSVCCPVFSQKIKNDAQSHLIKTYPAFNLPEDVFTYDVDVVISDGSSLSDYNLKESVLQNTFLQMNYFRRDSINARLKFEIFIEAWPYELTYRNSVNEYGQTVSTPVFTSKYLGAIAVYLDKKMIDYKMVDLSTSPGRVVNANSVNTQHYSSQSVPASPSGQIVYYSSAWYDKEAAVVNGSQIRKIYEVAATYFKNTFDINYTLTRSTIYKAKVKDSEYIRQDTTYKAVLSTLKNMNVSTYQSSCDRLKSYLQVWNEEKDKFNAASPEEAPIAWTLYMNMATVSDILEDYKAAFAYLKEADNIGTDRRLSSNLKNTIDSRAKVYYQRYNDNGSYRTPNIVYLDYMSPEDEYNKRMEKQQQEYDLQVKRDQEKSLAEKNEKYKYVIFKQPGSIETKDGQVIKGLISYSSEVDQLLPGVPTNNRVYFYSNDSKNKEKMTGYAPDKLRKFTLADGTVYESILIELNAQEKVKNHFAEHRRFYKLLYASDAIALYSYTNHQVHQYTFKLTGNELAQCTGFGEFLVNPNKALSELLKASPIVSAHAASVGTSIFADQPLIQICEAYTNSLKK